MLGGVGDDTYFADNANDDVVEALNAGTDIVYAAASYSLVTHANVENLSLLSSAGAGTATGNSLANSLTGNDDNNTLYGYDGNDELWGLGGNDYLVGGAGADHMLGGDGDDTYVVDDLGDDVFENAGDGYDRVNSFIDYTLTDNVDTLALLGGALNGTGNGLRKPSSAT